MLHESPTDCASLDGDMMSSSTTWLWFSTNKVRHPHAVDDSEQQDRMKKMEREYERRQQEILLEAEAAVRAREEALNQVLEIIF